MAMNEQLYAATFVARAALPANWRSRMDGIDSWRKIRFADFVVLGVGQFVAEILFHEIHIAVDGLDPCFTPALLLDPLRVGPVVDELGERVPEIFFASVRELADALRDLPFAFADLAAIVAVEDVRFRGLRKIHDDKFRLDGVLDLFDRRYVLRGIPLVEFAKDLLGNFLRIIARTFPVTLIAFAMALIMRFSSNDTTRPSLFLTCVR